METEISNWEVIGCCETWLNCTRNEKWNVDGETPEKVGSALFHIAKLVLNDMKFLAQMGDAGLGHGTGPQVRRLLEISTVAWDMREHDDATIAIEVFAAWQEKRSVSQEQISRSRRRIKGENGGIPKKIEGVWAEYNSESHFNLRERSEPAIGAEQVRHGISMGYLVINEFAQFREKHLPGEYRTESTREAEILLDECSSAFLG